MSWPPAPSVAGRDPAEVTAQSKAGRKTLGARREPHTNMEASRPLAPEGVGASHVQVLSSPPSIALGVKREMIA